jgi:hypothetical protein
LSPSSVLEPNLASRNKAARIRTHPSRLRDPE